MEDLLSVMACVGAVVGAGFASGQEIVSFFSRYGWHSWWLIVLCAAVMAALCGLCMYQASRTGACGCWCRMLPGWLPQGCVLLLMIVTGGAMTAAAGQMIALAWANDWAYSTGVVGSLLLAWKLSFGSQRGLAWLGMLLTASLAVAAGFCLVVLPPFSGAVLTANVRPLGLLGAGLRAVGYAAMNLTLVLGVVCRCAGKRKNHGRAAALFGVVMAALKGMSNALLLRHPHLLNQPLPMVRLLAAFGKQGFWASVAVMYVSILTTLSAVIYALRIAVQKHVRLPALRAILVLGLPLGMSRIGFGGIVDMLYAPAGWVCLAGVFAPLVKAIFKPHARKEKLDNPASIQ